jgi:type IV secretory pathway TraG/TraD family ATPase VirD4
MDMTHGTRGLELGFALVFIPMLAAMIRGGASPKKYLFSPFLAALLVVVAGIATSLVGIGAALQVAFAVVLLIALGYFFGRVLSHEVAAGGPTHRRGAFVLGMRSPGGGNRRGTGSTPPITLAGMPVDPQDEVMHFKIIGTTGTGKSTAIREMLAGALARGDRVIVADPDGGYLSRFYDAKRGDVILNPFDPDSVKWDLLGEIENVYDVDQLARSLIPDGGESHRIWTGYARTFFTALVQQAMAVGIKDDREIYRLIHGAPVAELKVMLAGTPAAPFLEEGSDKMFASLRSVASSAVEVLKYTTQQDGVPFSVRQWVREGASVAQGGRGGVLFLPYKAGEIAALRSVISAWLRLGIFQAMDGEEVDQHLWFVIDELDALGEIDGLKDALARLRKFGGRCIIGLQSISQASSTYGKGPADTIVENCGSTVILRCSAGEMGGTSAFASRLIGQREVVHTMHSRTRAPGEWLSSTTSTEQRSIEPAVMASEIERLPNLQGYLKFASIPDWHRITLTHVEYPIVRQRRSDTKAPPIRPAAVVPASVGAGAAMAAAAPAPAPRSRVAARKGGRKPKVSETP